MAERFIEISGFRVIWMMC